MKDVENMVQPPTGTVTFLFTDIEGSTKLWESQPDAMRSALARHDELLRSAIEANGGYVFKTVGDSFCAAFGTAHEALAGALSAQLALAVEAWELESAVRVRMALHTGASEERGGDYFGPPLNRVARLLSAGHGGQTLISLVTQELIRDTLPPSTSLLDLGDASLKDLSRPERVYQLQHPSLPVGFPPLRALDNPALPNNLPQQPTSFIGREKEMDDIKALLRKTRLLTLVGSGGAGKTRLALQAAADMLDGGGDGVWLVELAPLTDPTLVAEEVAQVLDVKDSSGQSAQRTLVEGLKNKNLLIVLDNCEHLIDACASLAGELLKSCPKVHLLATSREPLGVVGEQIYRIPSLSMPESGSRKTPTAESLSQYEAVRLFIERAQAVKPSFTVTDQNAPAVAQVCYHLDGIPLAIELAAARLRSLPVEEVNARLDSRFRLLTGGARNTLPRQQTLRALIDWSYDLLADQEKTVLHSLSVFSGGWSLEAAEALCADDGIENWEALDLLTSLADKSLVVYEEMPDSTARYRMLETIRQYGQVCLSEVGETDSVKSRHQAIYQALAADAEKFLVGPEAMTWLSRLEIEHDNVRAALQWCMDEQNPDGAEAGLLMAEALWRFWYVHAHLSEGRQWLERVLRRAEGLDAPSLLKVRANVLNGAGNLADCQSDWTAARPLYEASLALRRQMGDRRAIAGTLSNLGNIAKGAGDFARSRTLYQESLGIMRQIEEKAGIALILNNLGGLYNEEGNFAEAAVLLEECLEYCRELGDQRGVGVAQINIANASKSQGKYADSIERCQESLEIFRQSGDKMGTANALHCMGDVASLQGHFDEARSILRESLDISVEIEDQLGICESLESLAELANLKGETERAIVLWSAAVELRKGIEAPLNNTDRENQQREISEAHARVGDETYARASLLGRSKDWQQAIAYALSDLT